MQNNTTILNLYETYADDVYRYILFLLRDKNLAEDLTQDTFLKVHMHLEKFKNKSSIRTWILKIARNAVYDHLRRTQKIQLDFNELIELNSDCATPEHDVLRKERVRLLYQALGELKPDYREVLILRKIHEISIRDTASILDWSEDQVKAKQARALSKLKDVMLQTEEGFVHEI